MSKTASFVVEVLDTRNHTWQGRIYWANKERTENFRSALELMQLISSAVAEGQEAEADEEEDSLLLTYV
jgi:hypothetical protein